MINLEAYTTYNGVTRKLISIGVDWNQLNAKYLRNYTYKGMFREFTVPLKFVKSDAAYLRNIFYTKGLSALVTVQVYKRNQITNMFTLEYAGRLDMGSFNDTQDSCSVLFKNGGLSSDYMADQDTVFDIPFPGSTVLQYDGMTNNYETVKQLSEYMFLETPAISGSYKLETIIGENDFRNIDIDPTTATGSISVNWGALDGYCITINKICRLNLRVTLGSRKLTLYGYSNPTSGRVYERLILTRAGVDIDLLTLTTTVILQNPGSYPDDVILPASYISEETGIIDLLPGDKIGLFTICENLLGSPTFFKIRYEADVASLKIETDIYSKLPEIDVKAMTAMQLFTALAQRIGSGYPVKSDFLTGKSLLLTCGAAFVNKVIDGVTQVPVVKTSFSQFFKSMNCLYNIGMGIEVISGVETLVIEQAEYFYNTTTVKAYANINEFELTVESPLIYSDIQAGYNDQNYGSDQFGAEEYNTSADWKTPQKVISNDYDIRSVYRADVYGPDYIRKKSFLYDKENVKKVNETLDTGADDDIFVFDCVLNTVISGVSYYILDRTSKVVISGLTYPADAYNLNIAPRENIIRHGNIIRSSLKNYETEYIYPASYKKNQSIITQAYPALSVAENAAIQVLNLANPLYVPYAVTFIAPVRYDLAEGIETAIYGSIEFTYKGKIFRGFIVEAEASLGMDKSQKIKLLLHPDTKLTDLI